MRRGARSEGCGRCVTGLSPVRLVAAVLALAPRPPAVAAWQCDPEGGDPEGGAPVLYPHAHDCSGVPAAESLFESLLEFPELFVPPVSRPGECPRVNINYRILRIGRLDADALGDCPAAQLAANLSSIIAAHAWKGVPQMSGFAAPRMALAADGPALLRLFGSRWPLWGLMAWARALRLCGRAASHVLACDGAEEPVAVRENTMRKQPDRSYWDAVLELSHRIAGMRGHVVWINAARLLFEPAISLHEWMWRAALSCPVGHGVLLAMHGLYHPWGGEHFADAPGFAGRIIDPLVQRGVSVDALLTSPWPLPDIFWQLSTRVDHGAAAALRTRWMMTAIRAHEPPTSEPVGLCEIGVRAVAIVRVIGAQAAYFPSWIGMLRATGYAGSIVALTPLKQLGACEAAVEWQPSLLCFGAVSASLEHEAVGALLAALEVEYDSVLLLNFDTVLLSHPIEGISDLLCHLPRPRPSQLFDRASSLPLDAPDQGGIRFLRGESGEALVRNFFLNSEGNPFLRPLRSLGNMQYDPPQDLRLPEASFASLDGFPDLRAVFTIGVDSPWLGALYRPLRLGPPARRRPELQRLCHMALLPHCSQDLLAAADEATNTSWTAVLAYLFTWQPGEVPRLRPRVFQIGPSSAATTSIRDFCHTHGLRTVKSYYKDLLVLDWIEEALHQHLPALHYLDMFDAYTDFLYPFYSRIPWCSDGCERRDENVTRKIERYLEIVSTLSEQYPYSKFIFNTRLNFPRWLSSQMYNCWPWLRKKKDAFGEWLAQWDACCGPSTGPLGNEDCWRDPGLRLIKASEDTTHEEWAHKVCCTSLPTFQWIWKAMHEGVQRIFAGSGPGKLLMFPIEGSSRRLSRFLGVAHRPKAWRKSHAE